MAEKKAKGPKRAGQKARKDTIATGRDDGYDPSFCEQVIEFGKAGKSRHQIASRLNASIHAVERWEELYPEFRLAMREAHTHAQNWWEDAGQEALNKPGFNTGVYNKAISGRFPKTYMESVRQHHMGEDGGAIKHEVTSINVIGVDKDTE